MFLKEYINNLQKLLEEHGDLELVYSKDDEGNEFSVVNFSPSILYTDEDFSKNIRDLEVYSEEDLDEHEGIEELRKVVCVN